LRRKITEAEYREILNRTPWTLTEVKKLLNDSLEVKAFIEYKGMSMLFFVYMNIVQMLKQLKQELDAYNEPENIYDDVAECITSAHAAELSNKFIIYKALIQNIESLIYTLYHSDIIAKSFLEHPELDNEFYIKVLPSDFGQPIILKLIEILSNHLTTRLRSARLIDKFASFTTNLFNVLNSIPISFEQERKLAVGFIEVLENILWRSVSYIFTCRIT
jgi:hypothetical protein